MQSDFDPRDHKESADDLQQQSTEKTEDTEEASYGGFKYKWEYDAYQKTARSKAAKEKSPVDVLLVCLTVFFIFSVLILSAVIVLDIQRQSENPYIPPLVTGEEGTAETRLLPETVFETLEVTPSEGVSIDAIRIDQLGIAGQIVTNDLSETYRIPCGFLVQQIYGASGSDIKQSGLMQGDIIVSIDSVPIAASEGIDQVLSAHLSGDIVYFCIYRNEAYIDLTVTYTMIAEENN